MLRGRVRVPDRRRAAQGRQRVDVTRVQRLGRPAVELRRPGRRRRVEAKIAQERQAMDEESAAHDEPQRPQRRTRSQ
jgi:hypothetical protein